MMKEKILTALFLVSVMCSFAQIEVRHNILESEVDTVYRKFNKIKFRTIVPQNAISFNAGYGIPIITNNGLIKDSKWHNKAGTCLNFGIDYKHQFMKTEFVNGRAVKVPSIVGIGFGLGVSTFRQSAFMKDTTEVLKVEKFNDFLGEVRISYKGITEKVSFTYLDIPLYLEIGRPSQVKISGYFNVGIKASLRISGNCSVEGQYTSTGDDKPTNCPNISDIPEMGLYSNKDIDNDIFDQDLKYRLSPFVLWGSLSSGVNIPFSNLEKNKVSKVILRIGAKIDFTFTSVSKIIEEPYFNQKGINYRSNILNSENHRIFMPGIDIKLIYCIN